MTKDDEYWKRKLDELELDMSAKSPRSEPSANPGDRTPQPIDAASESGSGAPSLEGVYRQSRAWFETLPTPGKGVVVLGGGILALSVVRTLVQVVTFSLSMGLFLLMAYGAYRFLGQRDSNDPS